MKLKHHIAFSTMISGMLYAMFKSWGLSATSFIIGIFTDIDHIIDYVIAHGLRIRLKEFFPFFYEEKHQKITLLFHGWEWLFCFSAAVVIFNFNPWLTGALVGYGHHIVTDYFYSKANARSYSLIWRWKKNFDSQVIFPREREYKS